MLVEIVFELLEFPVSDQESVAHVADLFMLVNELRLTIPVTFC